MMKSKLFNRFLFMLLISLIFGCSSNEREVCMKQIEIQRYSGMGNFSTEKFDVPCDYPEYTENDLINLPTKLQNFSYEVLHFEFIPDTGNFSNRFEIQVKLNNHNDFNVDGFPAIRLQFENGLPFLFKFE